MRILALAQERHVAGLKRFLLLLIAALLFFLPSALAAHADGFIIPVPPPHPIEPVPDLAVKYHRVRVTIEDQVAQTEIDQVFFNASPYELEGTYIFPLPEEAAISDFSMFVDEQRLSGKTLSKDEARRIYEEIVGRRRDPALLEYVGRNAFQASIYPIAAHGEKRVQISYAQILRSEVGLVHYSYPLNTERFSSRPLQEVAIDVELHSKIPIRTIYSPSHKISVERRGENSVRVSFEANDVRPDKDFELYYGLSTDDVGFNLLSYKESGDDGFFLLLVTPPPVEVDEVVAKDVILVLDVSGSMTGRKLEQAQEALYFILDRLNPEDRFNIIAFDTRVKAYASELQPASRREDAREFVRRLEGGGSTDIDAALMQAMSMAASERPAFVLFLTDGLPTAGVTDIEQIIADVDRTAGANVRLFAFGVGYDVNTFLLDTISQSHRGSSSYVEPGEDIEEEVSAFYHKIGSPLLSDLHLNSDGVVLEDMYPYPLPDLFSGGELLVVGRYREGSTGSVSLQGTLNGEKHTFSYRQVRFAERGGLDSIPRLWATRKIGYMLQQVRLHGENKELVDSIVALSVRYGIMTPYTSFLVDEDQEILTETGRARVVAGSPLAAPKSMPQMGAQAVTDSQAQKELFTSTLPGGEESAVIKQVADKAFILRNDFWTDTSYDPQKSHVTRLAFGSPAYFGLLAEHPQWGRYLAVGERVIVVLDGTAYQIDSEAGGGIAVQAPTPRPLSPWEQFWAWFRSVTR